ncbi:hypothetical protein HD806DRAFT_552765 [Xylariaceae sp. AK1471]|nr:hypothetical protein HD806DRAFT_552765 [Xylariaceae sp. AK1471]
MTPTRLFAIAAYVFGIFVATRTTQALADPCPTIYVFDVSPLATKTLNRALDKLGYTYSGAHLKTPEALGTYSGLSLEANYEQIALTNPDAKFILAQPLERTLTELDRDSQTAESTAMRTVSAIRHYFSFGNRHHRLLELKVPGRNLGAWAKEWVS